ncbi:hypothetical protein [Luteimonas wenzhouensis]|uniref:Polymer-forming cytoskeletal protein n=1 Tax=Luteimonas wenzhouensis TaxID=2599615 RepID=A0A5C5TYX7_9GAMM|nr:hypothetical protein [Luteimonas wenzhouensis]NLW97731.1 hypothetical protein [Xanthomonadaceae bacterium]TWT18360.1 hypothetical protein FQY79_10780 [Luteimonas wenzhouensis]
MKRVPSFLVLACGALLAAAPALAQQDISKVNGSIVAQAGRAYGDVETVNGSISIETGAQVEDAETVNGSINAGDDVVADSLTTVNGQIRVGARARIRGDVETVNGGIFIDRGSSVGGDVGTVNGAIGLVAVDLAGDISTVGGDITVGVGSHVRGGVTVSRPSSNWFPVQIKRRPKVIIGPDAVVEGPLRFEREVNLYVHETARTGPVTGATPVSYSGARAPRD